MAEHNELGKLGRNGCRISTKRYTILQTNYTFQKAEIDILAQKKNTLAVVEVKTRSSLNLDCLRILLNQKNPASC
jgi:putative endonuclease